MSPTGCRLWPCLLLAAGLASAEPRTFDTVAQLAAAGGLAADQPLLVKGHHQPGDGGGGTFRYDPASQRPADGGAVVQPATLPGRLIRQVSLEDEALAEWFGAYGDGDGANPHDDHAAINKCLAAYGRVKLLAKAYGVRGKPAPYNPAHTFNAIDLGPYYRIVGAGRERTKVKLLDGTNPVGGGPGNNYFIVFYNRAFHESADHVVISDLTIDCNFDGQDGFTTIHAIGLRGGGALVERLNLRGYGTGCHPETNSSRECFVVHQTLVYKDAQACRRAATYRDLDLTGCGHNGKLKGNVAEITHLCLGGANNFENSGWIRPRGKDPDWDPADGGENERNWWPSYGGLIENCVIHDEVYDPPTQKSPLNGITYSDCVGLTVRGNTVRDFEGAAVFTMSWWNRETTIVDNDLQRVTVGLALNMASEHGKPIQCPRHDGVLFAHNRVETGAHRNAPWGTTGISLFGGDFPAVLRMQRIHIRENTISGRAFAHVKVPRACPLGINVQILRAAYHDLRFEDNTLDFPDYSPGPVIPQEPDGMAMRYYPLALWADAVKQGHVVYRGNRSRQGKVLYPHLADWYFKNEPTWGKP